MRVLVAYATRYGSTKGIAERIGATLNDCGMQAEVVPVKRVQHAGDYDAYVIGSAAYMFHWLKEATEFVHRNLSALGSKPVWLFTSGPLGTAEVDSEGKDVRAAATPPEIAEFIKLVHAREHHVFFGAYDASGLSFVHRLALMLSTRSIKRLMIEGDYRNWNEIETWSKGIANSLGEPSAAEHEAKKKVAAAALAATTAAVNVVVLPGAH